MMFGLLLVAATTALHRDDAIAISASDAVALERALQIALESAGRTEVVLDPDRTRCAREPACIAGIMERTGSEQIVVYSVAGGATRNLVLVELFDGTTWLAQEEVLLPIDALVTDFELELRAVVARLGVKPSIAKELAIVEPIEPAPWSPGGVILLSSGAATLVAGVVIGVLGVVGRRELAAGLTVVDPSTEALALRVERYEISTAVLLPVGILLAGAGALIELW